MLCRSAQLTPRASAAVVDGLSAISAARPDAEPWDQFRRNFGTVLRRLPKRALGGAVNWIDAACIS